MKRRYSPIMVLIAVVFLVLPLLFPPLILLLLILSFSNDTYITDSIEDYGIYDGNWDNKTPTDFISSFFPEDIEDSFSDVVYHYKANDSGFYAFEAYLEFRITDTDDFFRYLETVIDSDSVTSSSCSSAFLEHTISNEYDINLSGSTAAINGALIGKVLYSPDEQTVIFWALGIRNEGHTPVTEFDFLFSRFDIDPVAYAEKTGN